MNRRCDDNSLSSSDSAFESALSEQSAAEDRPSAMYTLRLLAAKETPTTDGEKAALAQLKRTILCGCIFLTVLVAASK